MSACQLARVVPAFRTLAAKEPEARKGGRGGEEGEFPSCLTKEWARLTSPAAAAATPLTFWRPQRMLVRLGFRV